MQQQSHPESDDAYFEWIADVLRAVETFGTTIDNDVRQKASEKLESIKSQPVSLQYLTRYFSSPASWSSSTLGSQSVLLIVITRQSLFLQWSRREERISAAAKDPQQRQLIWNSNLSQFFDQVISLLGVLVEWCFRNVAERQSQFTEASDGGVNSLVSTASIRSVCQLFALALKKGISCTLLLSPNERVGSDALVVGLENFSRQCLSLLSRILEMLGVPTTGAIQIGDLPSRAVLLCLLETTVSAMQSFDNIRSISISQARHQSVKRQFASTYLSPCVIRCTTELSKILSEADSSTLSPIILQLRIVPELKLLATVCDWDFRTLCLSESPDAFTPFQFPKDWTPFAVAIGEGGFGCDQAADSVNIFSLMIRTQRFLLLAESDWNARRDALNVCHEIMLRLSSSNFIHLGDFIKEKLNIIDVTREQRAEALLRWVFLPYVRELIITSDRLLTIEINSITQKGQSYVPEDALFRSIKGILHCLRALSANTDCFFPSMTSVIENNGALFGMRIHEFLAKVSSVFTLLRSNRINMSDQILSSLDPFLKVWAYVSHVTVHTSTLDDKKTIDTAMGLPLTQLLHSCWGILDVWDAEEISEMDDLSKFQKQLDRRQTDEAIQRLEEGSPQKGPFGESLVPVLDVGEEQTHERLGLLASILRLSPVTCLRYITETYRTVVTDLVRKSQARVELIEMEQGYDHLSFLFLLLTHFLTEEEHPAARYPPFPPRVYYNIVGQITRGCGSIPRSLLRDLNEIERPFSELLTQMFSIIAESISLMLRGNLALMSPLVIEHLALFLMRFSCTYPFHPPVTREYLFTNETYFGKTVTTYGIEQFSQQSRQPFPIFSDSENSLNILDVSIHWLISFLKCYPHEPAVVTMTVKALNEHADLSSRSHSFLWQLKSVQENLWRPLEAFARCELSQFVAQKAQDGLFLSVMPQTASALATFIARCACPSEKFPEYISGKQETAETTLKTASDRQAQLLSICQPLKVSLMENVISTSLRGHPSSGGSVGSPLSVGGSHSRSMEYFELRCNILAGLMKGDLALLTGTVVTDPFLRSMWPRRLFLWLAADKLSHLSAISATDLQMAIHQSIQSKEVTALVPHTTLRGIVSLTTHFRNYLAIQIQILRFVRLYSTLLLQAANVSTVEIISLTGIVQELFNFENRMLIPSLSLQSTDKESFKERNEEECAVFIQIVKLLQSMLIFCSRHIKNEIDLNGTGAPSSPLQRRMSFEFVRTDPREMGSLAREILSSIILPALKEFLLALSSNFEIIFTGDEAFAAQMMKFLDHIFEGHLESMSVFLADQQMAQFVSTAIGLGVQSPAASNRVAAGDMVENLVLYLVESQLQQHITWPSLDSTGCPQVSDSLEWYEVYLAETVLTHVLWIGLFEKNLIHLKVYGEIACDILVLLGMRGFTLKKYLMRFQVVYKERGGNGAAMEECQRHMEKFLTYFVSYTQQAQAQLDGGMSLSMRRWNYRSKTKKEFNNQLFQPYVLECRVEDNANSSWM